ncbi:MAG: hypothetical protein ACRDSZ_03505 [Pseudonocardiaceae bacterium]
MPASASSNASSPNLLGEQVWAESGLGAHDDVEQLKHRITTLEQHIVELIAELGERTQELEAAAPATASS